MAIEEPVLVDTGPLVAWMNARDTEHQACVDVFRALPVGKAFTCWPVLTETSYLMRVRLNLANPGRLLDAVADNVMQLLTLGRDDIQPTHTPLPFESNS